ncbi:SGF29 tudor-like domain-containing protein [Mycena floridula]|nr:SGF29 tudor-like domain-containing protein [Mycena floridula]
MDRRRAGATRPASSEEIECWTHAAASLTALSNLWTDAESTDTIGRVNRLISVWPVDDMLPAEGIDSVKSTYNKLASGLEKITKISEREIKAIDETLEQLSILIALRKAPEMLPIVDKRNKRPRAPSPSAAPVAPPPPVPSAPTRGVSITLPPRASVGPSPAIPYSKDPKLRREALASQLPLAENRKVAFHPTSKVNGSEPEENNWILAIITKCINADKNRYEVMDPEISEETSEPQTYNTTLRSIIPLPDPDAPAGSPSSLSAYRQFVAGDTVMALYPDTSCFYRAEVISTPKDQRHTKGPAYKVRFDDDDNQEHVVMAQWVVEYPKSGKSY